MMWNPNINMAFLIYVIPDFCKVLSLQRYESYSVSYTFYSSFQIRACTSVPQGSGHLYHKCFEYVEQNRPAPSA